MDAWHSIQIGSLWLTADNTSTGGPMINNITGLGTMKNGRVGQTITALDGTVWKQRFPITGLPFSINFPAMDQTNFNAATAIVSAADAAGTNLAIRIAGLTDTYSLTAATGDNPIEFDGSYIATTIFNVTFNFIVQSQTMLLTPTGGALTLTGQSITLTKTP
jgi:hypothetical protein